MMMETNENEQVFVVEIEEDGLEEVSGGRYVTSAYNGVDVRAEASNKSRSLGKVYKGDKLTFADEKVMGYGGYCWYKVKYEGGYGWINGRYAKLARSKGIRRR